MRPILPGKFGYSVDLANFQPASTSLIFAIEWHLAGWLVRGESFATRRNCEYGRRCGHRPPLSWRIGLLRMVVSKAGGDVWRGSGKMNLLNTAP